MTTVSASLTLPLRCAVRSARARATSPTSASLLTAPRLRLRLATRRVATISAVAAPPAPSGGLAPSSISSAFDDVPRSGLDGQALRFPSKLPTKAEVLAAIPQHCFKRDTAKSMGYAALSTAMMLGCGLVCPPCA